MVENRSLGASESFDRFGSGKLYQRLAEVLIDSIASGGYRQGQEFPSESEIISRYGVSRATVRHALEILERRGFVFRQPGKATIVARTQPVIGTGHRIGHLAEELKQLGLNVHSYHNEVGVVSTPKESLRRLGVECTHAEVFSCRHTIYGNGNPISYAINYVLDDPTRFHITASELDSRGLYNILAQDYQLDVFNGEQTIAAVLASKELAEVFQTSPDSPLLVTEIVCHTTTGQAAVYAMVWYDPRNFLFRQLIAR